MLPPTPFTSLLGIQHPIALAPMGGSAGGALAAAVSNGGGLGLLGGGLGGRAWLERELGLVAASTTQPWGVGFLAWAVEVATVEWTLTRQPHAIMLSFGDPAPFAARIKDAGVALLIQVTDLDEARQAADLGVDIIIAQGSEAGGHGGRRATLPFVPAVADLVAPIPVLAAGGIADGRGVAAALALGAAGALIGTRFQACREALVPAELSKALVDGRGSDTERTRILDIARGSAWPERYTARVLRNAFLEEWRGREDELTASPEVRQAYKEAARRHDLNAVSVWAGEALDLITSIGSAADMVPQLAADAAAALARAAGHDPG
ncbi:MAG TPA: nitronate monooxygenase [Streptosporangiaceae bacterium]|nr:nitronate monooxygenase [Streptosporangiaceae bacterium]